MNRWISSRSRAVAKWTALAFELYLLLVFINAALLVPYPYDWTRIGLIIGTACAAAVCAWGSGLGFDKSDAKMSRPRAVIRTPPIIIWLVVTVAVLLILAIASAGR